MAPWWYPAHRAEDWWIPIPGLASMTRCVLCGHPVWIPRDDRERLYRALVANVVCIECMPHDLEDRALWNMAGRPVTQPRPFAPVVAPDEPLTQMMVMIR